MRNLNAVDLFAGCGGLTLGLRMAGFRVLGAVEIDSLAAETYRANHKRVVVWQRDIRGLSVQQMLQKLKLRRGELDLLAGCPPCQGFSSLTTLNGARDSDNSNNDLVLEYLRFAKGLLPKALMMENVPGLANDVRLRRIVRSLRALGYKTKYEVLDAADYGVPQRRKRFILIASRFRPASFAHASNAQQTVRSAFRRLTECASNDALQAIGETRNARVSELIRAIPPDGGSRSDLGKKSQLRCHQKCDGFSDVYGRMAWDRVAPTITGGCCNPSKGRFLHPSKHRNITLREAALLQSFPPGYSFSLRRGKFAAAQMIGNALPPEFIRRHAKNVSRAIAQK